MARFLRTTLFFLLCCSTVTMIRAQQEVYDESTILLKDAMMGGLQIHPKGWGLNFAIGRQNTVDRMALYGVEIVGMKHHKEVKTYSRFFEDAKGYAYGKLNSFYIVRPSIGLKRMITDKLRKNGVEIAVTSRLGPSLGITKPIYLEIRRSRNDVGPGEFTSVERYDPEIHDLVNIYGKASAFRGFGEMNLHPGIFANLGMLVEYSPYQRGLKAVEAGIMADYYFDKVPIMASDEENKSLFLNFYVNVMFGKKYNRNIKE